MRTELLTPVIDAVPGEPVAVRVEVVNTSTVIDEVVLDAPDLDPQWIAGEDRRAALFPDSKVELEARIDLPSHFPAGEHQVELVVGSSISPDAATRLVATVRLPATGTAELDVRPALVNGGSKARFRAIVTNHSNREMTLAVDARDAVRALTFSIEPRHLTLAARSSAEAVIEATGRRAWLGSPLARPLTIVVDGAGEELKAAATFNQKARIPRGAVTAATLALILLVWVTAFTFGVNRVLDAEATGKHAPDLFPLPQVDLDLAAVSGSISGEVTASNTGGGLSRVVVEAYRNTADGPEIAGSAATDADGVFELSGLLPGNYLLKASAPGFEPSWSGRATSAADAAPTKVEPSAATDGLALMIDGDPGSIGGRVVVDTAAGEESTASVALIPVSAGVRGEVLTSVSIGDDGAFTIGKVPTPGDFELVISAEGFEDRLVPVTLRGGEDAVMNTVRLSADPGVLGGLVTSGGEPLGGVAVSISNGSFETETTTPTSGEVGKWVAPDLPTPATYLVEFSLDGYRTEIVAIDLGPGQSLLDVETSLAGGVGTIAGLVVDQDGNPLAGVQVAVSGGALDAETQTLTGGEVGSWRMADLPTPGRYALTFSADGYSTETRVVELAIGAGVPDVEVTMARVVGALSGTVLVAGSPRGGVEVAVGDGAETRTTTSATDPPGRWSIGGLPAGTYTVTFSGGGVVERTLLITVEVGQDRAVDVDLASQ